jgi:hypothetical protein
VARIIIFNYAIKIATILVVAIGEGYFSFTFLNIFCGKIATDLVVANLGTV